MLNNITWKIVHLTSATEREYLVKRLEEMFQATRFDAVVGATVANKYEHLTHPVPGEANTNGIFGCSESHFLALKELQEAPTEFVGIFEDDAIFSCEKQDVEEWLQSLPQPWDVALLGTTKTARASRINEHTVKIRRFWGAHAVIFRKSVLPKLFDTFNKYVTQERITPLTDWWYAWAIQEHHLDAYAPRPSTHFCYQKDGLISAITGKVRGLPALL